MASKLAIAALLQSAQAATFSSDMDAMACFGATTAADTTAYNGQYCLAANSWTSGQCCDFTAAVPADGLCAVAPQSDGSAYASDAAFCGRKTTISNKFLREFLIPADSTYCPTEYAINQVGTEPITKVHDFNLQVPTTAAASWHCKYGISASNKIPAGTAEASRGYIYLVAESYGFDNNVIVIVQPRG